MSSQSKQNIRWFRNSAPYINAHRGQTFVLTIGGEAALHANFANIIHDIEHHHTGKDKVIVEEFLSEFHKATIEEKCEMLQQMKQHTAKAELTKKERKALRKVYHQELVKRSALLKIAAAWIITVPASAIMAAILFFTIRGMMLP